MKMKKRSVLLFSVSAAVLFLSACSTDYRADAVEQAREYALDHTEGLTVLQRNYIRYNNPVILNKIIWRSTVPVFSHSGHIVTRYDRNVYTDPGRDMLMQCMAWSVPDMDGDLTVVGYGQRDFRFWEPNRIVIRKEQDCDIAGETIQKKAMLLAVDSIPGLSGRLRTRVRFAIPEVYTSLFLLEEPAGQEDRTGDWMSFLKKAADREPLQISAVWTDPESGNCVIVAGFSSDRELKTWIPKKTFEMTSDEAKTSLGLKYSVRKSGAGPVMEREQKEPAKAAVRPTLPEGESEK